MPYILNVQGSDTTMLNKDPAVYHPKKLEVSSICLLQCTTYTAVYN